MKLSVAGISVIILFLLRSSLKAALTLSIQDDRYIQILAAPLICLYLLYWDRARVFSSQRPSPRLGAPLFALAVIACVLAVVRQPGGSQVIGLIPALASLTVLLQAGFVLCFGTRSYRAGIYALSCLWLAIPLPPATIDSLSAAYQQGSAGASYAILDFFGVSVLRDGTSFSIPGLDFRIAPECSGIRSGVAFLLVGILAGRLFLRSGWGRSVLILSTIPIAMFKNAIRIVVTTTLGAYVNRAFIDGPFHHQYGGLVFAPVDFLLFVPLLLALQRFENRTAAPAPASTPAPSAV